MVDGIVTIDAIRTAFTALNLSAFSKSAIDKIVDEGYEETVPVASLVKLLRGAGIDGATALDVKKAARSSSAVLPKVRQLVQFFTLSSPCIV